MVSLKQIIILTLATLATAAPMAKDCGGSAGQSQPAQFQGHRHQNQGSGTPAASSAPAPAPSQPVQTVSAPEQSSSDDDDDDSTPVGISSASTTNAGSTSNKYIDVVNKWRKAGGLKTLVQSSKLEGNALKTASDGNGQLKHELNSGSFAQVLASGDSSNFENVYVHQWLCERPNLQGLNGVCNSRKRSEEKRGQTGHADILTSSSYSTIGCAFKGGVWACDLGF